MLKKVTIGLGLLAVLVITVPAAMAQVTETDELALLRADIMADRQAVVAANLDLTEAEGARFWPMYREYRQEMMKVGDRTQKVLQEFLKSYETMSADQAKAMLAEMLDMQAEETKLKKSYVKKFGEVLPVVKVVRLYQIDNKIDAIIRYDLAASIPLVRAGS